jgi:fibro-slime domain-containing protein
MNSTLTARVVSLCTGALLCAIPSAAQPSGQQYPDSIWIPVIFYDFHADHSNPEFEAEPMAVGLKTGMVRADQLEYEAANADYFGLAQIAKPLRGDSPFFNYDIAKWFRAWKAGDFVIPVYSDSNGNAYTLQTVNHDTAFINLVLKDSLPLVHKGNGLYQFSRSGGGGEAPFFWLDGKGYGNEPAGWDHNFAFTMELHHEFTYQTGMTFDFNGDDDVWVFINGKLAMDLGGRHGPLNGSFNVDDIAAQAGMEVGGKYLFDFFYCERHTGYSTIQITTNILTPATLELVVLADTVEAGSTQEAARAIIRDSYGNQNDDYARQVTWSLVDDVRPGDQLLNEVGSTVSLTATQAFRTVSIEARYAGKTTSYSYILYDTVEIYVKPGPPYAVSVEKWSDARISDSKAGPQTFGDSTNAKPVNSMQMERGEDTLYACAVTRDRFGNYTGLASGAQWTTIPAPSAARAEPLADGKWQAIILRIAGDSARVHIKASQDGLVPGTVLLVLDAVDMQGPEISRALYFLGSLPYEAGEVKADTLIVFFNEPVRCRELVASRQDPSSVFEYNGEQSREAVFEGAYVPDEDMDACQDSVTQVRIILPNPRQVHPLEDSIAISGGKLVDRYENAAPANGPEKPVEWGRAYDWVLSCSPNPFNPSSDILPVQVRDMVDSRGEPLPAYATVIEIASVTPVDIDDSRATIYDAVGNVVQEHLPVYRNRDDPFRYEILWNGHNRNGRIVGWGTYLAVVYVEGSDGDKQTVKKATIGVSR